MLVCKLTECGQITNFLFCVPKTTFFRLDIPCFCFPFKPEINGNAANPKEFTGFTFRQSVLFNGLDYFLPEIISVGFGHK